MKKLIILIAVLSFVSCGETKKEEPAMIKKVVCGDSVDTEMFNQDGEAFTVRVAGKCDTILVPAAKE